MKLEYNIQIYNNIRENNYLNAFTCYEINLTSHSHCFCSNIILVSADTV